MQWVRQSGGQARRPWGGAGVVGWLEEHLGGCGLTGAARREAGAGSPDDPDTGRRWPQAWPTAAVRGGAD